jgi:hypothetical protein
MNPNRAVMKARVSAAREGGGAVRERITCLCRSDAGTGRYGRSLGWSLTCGYGSEGAEESG